MTVTATELGLEPERPPGPAPPPRMSSVRRKERAGRGTRPAVGPAPRSARAGALPNGANDAPTSSNSGAQRPRAGPWSRAAKGWKRRAKQGLEPARQPACSRVPSCHGAALPARGSRKRGGDGRSCPEQGSLDPTSLALKGDLRERAWRAGC